MQRFGEWLKTNQGIGSILSLVFTAFLIYLLLSPWVYKKLYDGFYLGLLPVAGVAAILIPCLTIIFNSQRKENPADLKTLALKPFLGIMLLIGGCGVYFVVMSKIGFLLITPVFLFVAMWALGSRRWWQDLIVAVGVPTIFYTLLRIIGLELPPGILAGILL